MIEEKARVTAIRDGFAVIEVVRTSGCQSCELKSGCGTGSLGRLLGFKPKPFTVKNELGLKPGDTVMLAVAERSFALAGFLVYLLPLLTLFLFAIVADVLLGTSDVFTVLAGLFGLATGLYFSGWFSRHTVAQNLQPKIVRQIW